MDPTIFFNEKYTRIHISFIFGNVYFLFQIIVLSYVPIYLDFPKKKFFTFKLKINCYRSPTKKINSKESRKGHISLVWYPLGDTGGQCCQFASFQVVKLRWKGCFKKNSKRKIMEAQLFQVLFLG